MCREGQEFDFACLDTYWGVRNLMQTGSTVWSCQHGWSSPEIDRVSEE